MISLVLLAVYGGVKGEILESGVVSGNQGLCSVSPMTSSFLTCGGLAMYNTSAGLDFKFECLQYDIQLCMDTVWMKVEGL